MERDKGRENKERVAPQQVVLPAEEAVYQHGQQEQAVHGSFGIFLCSIHRFLELGVVIPPRL